MHLVSKEAVLFFPVASLDILLLFLAGGRVERIRTPHLLSAKSDPLDTEYSILDELYPPINLHHLTKQLVLLPPVHQGVGEFAPVTPNNSVLTFSQI